MRMHPAGINARAGAWRGGRGGRGRPEPAGCEHVQGSQGPRDVGERLNVVLGAPAVGLQQAVGSPARREGRHAGRQARPGLGAGGRQANVWTPHVWPHEQQAAMGEHAACRPGRLVPARAVIWPSGRRRTRQRRRQAGTCLSNTWSTREAGGRCRVTADAYSTMAMPCGIPGSPGERGAGWGRRSGSKAGTSARLLLPAALLSAETAAGRLRAFQLSTSA